MLKSICSYDSDEKQASTGSDNSLVPIKQQTIIWTS